MRYEHWKGFGLCAVAIVFGWTEDVSRKVRWPITWQCGWAWVFNAFCVSHERMTAAGGSSLSAGFHPQLRKKAGQKFGQML